MTIQTPERLIYQGVEHVLNGDPLSQHIPKLKFNSAGSFCRRGYHGTWNIKANRLYLVDLTAWKNDPESRQMVPQMRVNARGRLNREEREQFDLLTLSLKSVFPGANDDGVHAMWFTGELSIGLGDKDENGQHETYQVFDFSSGVLLSQSIKQRDEVIKPFDIDELRRQIKESINNRRTN